METTGLQLEASGSVERWSGKKRNQENFPVGSLLIRASLRPHVHAFYDFARKADDIGDSPTLAAEEKLRRLEIMENVLLGRQEGGSPAALRLRASLRETGVTADHSLHLLHAFKQDAVKSRYASWDELIDYCRYSAMPVGRHVLDLHGESRDTWAPSDALCAVLQVLNHLQDGSKDLRALDRCYLPLDWMGEAGAVPGDLLGPAETPALRAVFARMLEACEALNRCARELPRAVRDRRLRLETAVIAGLAGRLTRRLRGGDPVATRVKLRGLDVAFSVAGAVRHLP